MIDNINRGILIFAILIMAACSGEQQPEPQVEQVNSNLNQMWCRLCAHTPTLSYCKYLHGQCGDVLIPVPEQDTLSGEQRLIQGTRVQLHAPAYVEMCAREPYSPLCPQ